MNRSIFLILLALAVGGCGKDETPPASDGWAFWDFTTPSGDGGCTSSNCMGCCNGGTCVQGTDKQFCGYGGSPCQTCLPNQSCNMGACTEPTCTATNCATGCCMDSKCQSGTADNACGTGGASCATCKTDEVCTGGACTAKGGAMYKITLVSARITGGCGTFELSACDAYVTLKVGKAQATSSIKVNNNDPVWNEYMLTSTEAELTQFFDVTVTDDDPIGSTGVDTCQGQLTTTHLKDGKYVHDCGSNVKDLTWQIDPV